MDPVVEGERRLTVAAPSSTGTALRAAAAVACRPRLWTTALRQAAALAPARWWARPPFLPVPSRPYLVFRLETQYGSASPPRPDDVVQYLSWCRRYRELVP